MSQRVLIRHSSGSKASTIEEFPVSKSKEWIFGRDASCDVRFDKDRDEFVSRRHMKLVVDDADRLEFSVIDLSALNGTFVNRRRVSGSIKVAAGDLVQLGAGGPEFIFDVAPEVASPTVPKDMDATRIQDFSEMFAPQEAPAPPSKPDAVEASQAVEIKPTSKHRSRQRRESPKKRFAGVGVLIALVLAALVYFVGIQRLGGIDAARAAIARGAKVFRADSSPSHEEIAKQNAESVAIVQTTWRLIDSASGRQLRQIYIPNRRDASSGNATPLIPGAGNDLPVFVLLTNNRLRPLLTVHDNNAYKPIGGVRRGSGFVVSPDGQILTSRSVTSPWTAPYEWLGDDAAGVVAVFDHQFKLAKTAVIARRQFPRWLPIDTEFVLEDAFNQDVVRVNHQIRGTGKADSLTITLADRQPVAGKPVKAVDKSSLVTVQLDGRPESRKITVAVDANPKPGDQLVLLGLPDHKTEAATLANIRSDGAYALSLASGTGSLGAPIFDQKGRVIAVETDPDPARPDQILAVPIRQALESLGHGLIQP